MTYVSLLQDIDAHNSQLNTIFCELFSVYAVRYRDAVTVARLQEDACQTEIKGAFYHGRQFSTVQECLIIHIRLFVLLR